MVNIVKIWSDDVDYRRTLSYQIKIGKLIRFILHPGFTEDSRLSWSQNSNKIL